MKLLFADNEVIYLFNALLSIIWLILKSIKFSDRNQLKFYSM